MTEYHTAEDGEKCQEEPVERAPRGRVLKAGVIAHNNSSITAKCVIRDVSEGGARLKVDRDLPVPETFMLTIPVDGSTVDCIVRWRTADQIGVAFQGPVRHERVLVREQAVSSEYVVPQKKTSLLRKPLSRD